MKERGCSQSGREDVGLLTTQGRPAAGGVVSQRERTVESMKKSTLKRIVTAVFAFVHAPTWEARKHIVETQQKDLFTREADQVLLRMLSHAANDPAARQQLGELRLLLARCASDGIDTAFANRPDSPTLPGIVADAQQQLQDVQSEDELRQLIKDHPGMLPLLSEATQKVLEKNPQMLALLQFAHPEFFDHLYAFISANTWAESQTCLERFPDLLTEEADYAMEWFIQQQKNTKAIQVLSEYRHLLRSCREVGIAQAFAEKRAPETAPRSINSHNPGCTEQ